MNGGFATPSAGGGGLTGESHPFIPGNAPTNPFLSDPGYQGALAQEQLGLGQVNANLNAEIARRLIDYGDPSFAAAAGFGVDPQSAAFARQNYLAGNAELARIDKAHNLARQAIINRLAAHGLLTSGDTGYLSGQENQAYGNNIYDAQQRALNDLYGYQQSALGQKQNLHDAVVSALQNAWQNYISHPEFYGTDGTTTPTPPTTKTPTVLPKTSSAATRVAHNISRNTGKVALPNAYTTGQKRFG